MESNEITFNKAFISRLSESADTKYDTAVYLITESCKQYIKHGASLHNTLHHNTAVKSIVCSECETIDNYTEQTILLCPVK